MTDTPTEQTKLAGAVKEGLTTLVVVGDRDYQRALKALFRFLLWQGPMLALVTVFVALKEFGIALSKQGFLQTVSVLLLLTIAGLVIMITVIFVVLWHTLTGRFVGLVNDGKKARA